MNSAFGVMMIHLPTPFVAYWSGHGPKEGPLAVQPCWFQLWHPDEVAQFNEEYQVGELAPGFGSSGGGEMLAFDSAQRVYRLPFIGMDVKEARLVADSWEDFVLKMESSRDDHSRPFNLA